MPYPKPQHRWAFVLLSIGLLSFPGLVSAQPQTSSPEDSLARAPAPDAPVSPAATPPAEASGAPPRAQIDLEHGARVESTDGRFGVRLGALTQFRAQLDEVSDGRFQGRFNTFYVRPQLRMHAFGNQLNVFVQPEFSGAGARLLDFEITYQPHEAFGMRVGQFMTPFSRGWLTPIPVLHMVDFGAANDNFRWGRDTGAMLMGQPFGGKLEYYLGVFNGNGIGMPTKQTVHGLGVARLAISPLGAVPYNQTRFLAGDQPLRFSIAVNGYAGRRSYERTITDLTTGAPITVQDPNQVHLAGGVDFALDVDRLTVLAEAFLRRNVVKTTGNPATDSYGLTAQAGYYFPAPRLELATRLTYTNQDLGTATNWLATYEGEVNWYAHGNHAKLQLRYLYADTGSAFVASSSSPLSSYFTGTQHRLLAQVQAFF